MSLLYLNDLFEKDNILYVSKVDSGKKEIELSTLDKKFYDKISFSDVIDFDDVIGIYKGKGNRSKFKLFAVESYHLSLFETLELKRVIEKSKRRQLNTYGNEKYYACNYTLCEFPVYGDVELFNSSSHCLLQYPFLMMHRYYDRVDFNSEAISLHINSFVDGVECGSVEYIFKIVDSKAMFSRYLKYKMLN